jgi:hypothetical protein
MNGVRIAFGATQLTRTPCWPYSIAAFLVSPTMPRGQGELAGSGSRPAFLLDQPDGLLAAAAGRLEIGHQDGGALPAELMGHLWGALGAAYEALGVDVAAGGDEVFRQLVLARIIEPTSKQDSLRVLAAVGVEAVSYPTLNRRLPGTPPTSGARSWPRAAPSTRPSARPLWSCSTSPPCASRPTLGTVSRAGLQRESIEAHLSIGNGGGSYEALDRPAGGQRQPGRVGHELAGVVGEQAQAQQFVSDARTGHSASRRRLARSGRPGLAWRS